MEYIYRFSRVGGGKLLCSTRPLHSASVTGYVHLHVTAPGRASAASQRKDTPSRSFKLSRTKLLFVRTRAAQSF
eukprot:scaffold3197_cov153-Skeletonema_menzelii.AAC.14